MVLLVLYVIGCHLYNTFWHEKLLCSPVICIVDALFHLAMCVMFCMLCFFLHTSEHFIETREMIVFGYLLPFQFLISYFAVIKRVKISVIENYRHIVYMMFFWNLNITNSNDISLIHYMIMVYTYLEVKNHFLFFLAIALQMKSKPSNLKMEVILGCVGMCYFFQSTTRIVIQAIYTYGFMFLLIFYERSQRRKSRKCKRCKIEIEKGDTCEMCLFQIN